MNLLHRSLVVWTVWYEKLLKTTNMWFTQGFLTVDFKLATLVRNHSNFCRWCLTPRDPLGGVERKKILFLAVNVNLNKGQN